MSDRWLKLIPTAVRRKIEHRPGLLKIVVNIGWLFGDRVLRMGVGLLVGVWIARYLGPEQFGLFSFATAFMGLFGAVAGLGLQGIVVRDIVRDPDGKQETLGTAALLLFIGGILAYALLLGTIFWLRPDDALARALVAILGSMALFKVGEVAVYWFESQVQSKYIVWVQNGGFLVFAAVKVGLIFTSAPLIAFAWVTAAEALLVALLMLGMLNRYGLPLRQLRFNFSRASSLFKDSWPLLLSGIAIMIYMKIDQIMLGQMVGDEAVGIYSAAVRISEVWYFIPMVIVSSVFPAILEAKGRSEAEYYNRLQRLYDLMVWLSLAIALPMTFLSTPLVRLLFGEAFSPSGQVLSIHIWASVFVFLGVAGGKWFIAENLQVISLQRVILGAISNIGLNIVLIPEFGYIGASVATLISYAVSAFLADAIYKKTRISFGMKLKAINIFYFVFCKFNSR